LKHELAPLKVRTAKLFPKNGSVTEQRQQLITTPIPIAVGTPHRLRQLSSAVSLDTTAAAGGGGGGGSLQWDHVQLVIIDNYIVPQKQYTVCTLPDTASACMNLLREYVCPQFVRRTTSTQQQPPPPPRKKNSGGGNRQKGCQITFLA
jgi:hypothetical protein